LAIRRNSDPVVIFEASSHARTAFTDGSRRNFLVEIDRGTMPVVRSRLLQRSRRRTRAPDAADVPCRRAWTDAGGALGREALDATMVASSARTTRSV
jgi:hypothetical protein